MKYSVVGHGESDFRVFTHEFRSGDTTVDPGDAEDMAILRRIGLLQIAALDPTISVVMGLDDAKLENAVDLVLEEAVPILRSAKPTRMMLDGTLIPGATITYRDCDFLFCEQIQVSGYDFVVCRAPAGDSSTWPAIVSSAV